VILVLITSCVVVLLAVKCETCVVWLLRACHLAVAGQWSGLCRLECEGDQVKSVYMSASTLKMHRATEACSQFLADNLTLQNCLSELGPVLFQLLF